LSADTIDEIVQFWLGPSLDGPDLAYGRRDWWYRGGVAVDEEIRDRFGVEVARACRRELMDWQDTPNGAFAMILLLDQFTRNLYRNTPDAYLGDACAFDVVNHAIDRKLDLDLHSVARIWLYHPFHHAETIEDQERGGALLQQVRESAPSEWHRYIDRSIWGWGRHRDIVARFGRFPHRNAVLGRESTEEEVAFLAENGQSFGQGPKKN
jgi:uncharacterized protein (DUF924 family)